MARDRCFTALFFVLRVWNGDDKIKKEVTEKREITMNRISILFPREGKRKNR